jgi:hypothetical protein
MIDIISSYRTKQSRKQTRKQPKKRGRPKQSRQNYDELVRYFPGGDIILPRLTTWNPKRHQFTEILTGSKKKGEKRKILRRYKNGIYLEIFRQTRNGMQPRFFAVHKAKQN